MRHLIQTGTDVAIVCFFDPAALPGDFDDRVREDAIDEITTLARSGRAWLWETGGDGGYLLHFYVEQDLPERFGKILHAPKHIESFHVPGGQIVACGAEYVARDPFAAGLAKFSHMGGKYELPAGDYSVTTWQTDWPEELIEAELSKRAGAGSSKKMNVLGIVTGIFLLGTVGLSFYALIKSIAFLTIHEPWPTSLWIKAFVAWPVCIGLMIILSRMEKNPARREVEQEFPDIVV